MEKWDYLRMIDNNMSLFMTNHTVEPSVTKVNRVVFSRNTCIHLEMMEQSTDLYNIYCKDALNKHNQHVFTWRWATIHLVSLDGLATGGARPSVQCWLNIDNQILIRCCKIFTLPCFYQAGDKNYHQCFAWLDCTLRLATCISVPAWNFFRKHWYRTVE